MATVSTVERRPRHAVCGYLWAERTPGGLTSVSALCGVPVLLPMPKRTVADRSCLDCVRAAQTHGLVCDCFRVWSPTYTMPRAQ